MIIQWPSGQNVVAYDTDTEIVSITTVAGEVIDGPRPATTSEVMYYQETYGSKTDTYNETIETLTSSLIQLRLVTEDSQVTPQEIAAALPIVFDAIYKFRDVGLSDPQILRLVILILSQINLVLFTLISGSGPRFEQAFLAQAQIQYRLDDIEERLIALEGS